MEDADLNKEKTADAGYVREPFLKRKQDAARESSKVFGDGLKMRASGIPWRYRTSSDGKSPAVIEVFLVESVQKPGTWTFPGGTLEAGEDVARCAARETEEECGVQGVLGCFVGVFEAGGKQGRYGSRSYVFCLHVHTVLEDGNDLWKDPGTSFEGDGNRRRRWFLPNEARPLIKTPEVLDAFLQLSREIRLDPWRRPPKEASPRLILLCGSAETEDHCRSRGRILYRLGSCLPPGKDFALFSAALWEADLVIAADVTNFEQVGYAIGLASAQRCSVLCVHASDARIPCLVGGDDQIRCRVVSSQDESPPHLRACSEIDNFLKDLGFSIGNKV